MSAHFRHLTLDVPAESSPFPSPCSIRFSWTACWGHPRGTWLGCLPTKAKPCLDSLTRCSIAMSIPFFRGKKFTLRSVIAIPRRFLLRGKRKKFLRKPIDLHERGSLPIEGVCREATEGGSILSHGELVEVADASSASGTSSMGPVVRQGTQIGNETSLRIRDRYAMCTRPRQLDRYVLTLYANEKVVLT